MSADPKIWFDANRRHWDERVAIHRRTPFYDVAGRNVLELGEIEEMGAVALPLLPRPRA